MRRIPLCSPFEYRSNQNNSGSSRIKSCVRDLNLKCMRCQRGGYQCSDWPNRLIMSQKFEDSRNEGGYISIYFPTCNILIRYTQNIVQIFDPNSLCTQKPGYHRAPRRRVPKLRPNAYARSHNHNITTLKSFQIPTGQNETYPENGFPCSDNSPLEDP